MKRPHKPSGETPDCASQEMDSALARQLERIAAEETPDHLLKLARELQGLLRDRP
ncbi:hypothetical protein [Roseivivax sediminis]|uniref:hypothetical protein n=1 Tax=Roseivivax sediminis TaxID=936889 RepID=UPI00165ED20B|nr:hypothetical protein [Roseivivax sediminis]